MFFRVNRIRKKWQKTFIADVFKNKANRDDNFSKIILNNTSFLESKEKHLPNTLCKYYFPTSDNIIDIQKQRLWLSHPSSFNDPFDCYTGYDTKEYERQGLLTYIKNTGCVDSLNSQEGFTTDELNRVYRSTTADIEYLMCNKIEKYDYVVYKILENKSEIFKQKVYNLIIESTNEINAKMEKLRNINIRVACFSEFNRYEGFKKNIQMWSHYADNHKGFCVEYDLSLLKETTVFSLKDYEYYGSEQSRYLDERLRAAIKGGLFPVIYTSSRVSIPVSKLKKVTINEIGDLHHNSDIDAILYKTYIVKSANWSYEKEWRIILDGNISSYYENKIPFPYIKRIYLGCKMDSQTIETMLEIGKELNVEVIMLTMDNKRFILEESSTDSYNWRKERLKWNNPFVIVRKNA